MFYSKTAKSTVISGHLVEFFVDLIDEKNPIYEVVFMIDGKLKRTDKEDKQHPGISRWVFKQFLETLKWADESKSILTCSAYEKDGDYEKRKTWYAKYMTQVSNNFFIYGDESIPGYKELTSPISTDIDFSFLD